MISHIRGKGKRFYWNINKQRQKNEYRQLKKSLCPIRKKPLSILKIGQRLFYDNQKFNRIVW